jgi:hypothetical protein
MKNLFEIGSSVEVVSNNKTVVINDFEFFGDLCLYYTNDKSAYPQSDLKPLGFKFLNNLLSLSNEEKNKQVNEAFSKHFGDLI